MMKKTPGSTRLWKICPTLRGNTVLCVTNAGRCHSDALSRIGRRLSRTSKKLPIFRRINLTRLLLRLRCTRIRCLLKCSPLQPTPWNLFNSSNG